MLKSLLICSGILIGVAIIFALVRFIVATVKTIENLWEDDE